jgi:hypothetical protein
VVAQGGKKIKGSSSPQAGGNTMLSVESPKFDNSSSISSCSLKHGQMHSNIVFFAQDLASSYARREQSHEQSSTQDFTLIQCVTPSFA